jgi:uncharacterized protein YPO0396
MDDENDHLRALVDAIAARMRELRGKGIGIWAVGIGMDDDAQPCVVVRLSELREDWMIQLREDFGDEVTFRHGGPFRLARKADRASKGAWPA